MMTAFLGPFFYVPMSKSPLFVCLLMALWATQATVSAQQIDFDRDIKPILSDRCYVCHGPDSEKREADLRLDTEEGAEWVLSRGTPEDSELLRRIESGDADEVMPPPDSNLTVSPAEIETIRKWLRQDAPWAQHWSFVAPLAPAPPETKHNSDIENEIDQFILARLDAEGLSPAVRASKEKQMRRVTFDLTGLPPTLKEIDAFVADNSATAYENLVDRLLASPRFGERMASDWLDVARYSDTYGYQVDRDRYVWPWRDWVVRAFNQNMPYDQFVTEQLAGDLLPNPTDDQILATTFNRLHPQKVEGGSVEEEFRVEYVADRTQTMGTAFLGLTVECARCHDHKYDPLSQKEYYQLFAFFNNIDEAGLYSFFDPQAVPTPSLLLMDHERKTRLAKLRDEMTELESKSLAVRDNCQQRAQDGLSGQETQEKDKEVELIRGPVFDADFTSAKLARNQLVQESDSREENAFVKLTGDDEIKFDAGSFRRYEPFSIVTRIRIPTEPDDNLIERNVIFHRSRAWTDSASRGYQLLIENGRLSASLIHFWPGNAICVATQDPVVTGEWIDVAMTYDGSSEASGLQIYVDGRRQPVDIVRNNLEKAIVGSGTDRLIIGARFRDRGFTDGCVSELKVFDRQLTPIEVAQLADGTSLSRALAGASKEWKPETKKSLTEYFVVQCDEHQQLLAEIQLKRTAIAKLIDEQDEIMVMRELAQPRPAFLLARGAYDARSEPVVAETPAVFPSLDKHGRPGNRLDLAGWLTNKRHPLAARVAVNRFWQLCFGQGLVQTPEDFGSQGAPPTHPGLLDWLACDFQRDWDIKRAIKQIVMSNTYRQSTVATANLRKKDPDNILLARAPTYRLPAEMLRDNVLYLSGLLVEKIGGPPVRPYEVAVAFKPTDPDKGEGLYRRSLYTYWKRTGPAPVMLTLDAAKRDVCQVKRERTASPLQALVLLNGPQFVEAARKLAEKLIVRHGDNSQQIAIDLFRMLTSRRPSTDELEVVLRLFEKQQAEFADNETAAEELIAVGDSESDTKQSARLAAWTTVASTLMNFDECVMKR